MAVWQPNLAEALGLLVGIVGAWHSWRGRRHGAPLLAGGGYLLGLGEILRGGVAVWIGGAWTVALTLHIWARLRAPADAAEAADARRATARIRRSRRRDSPD